jgi:hypothetical protein
MTFLESVVLHTGSSSSSSSTIPFAPPAALLPVRPRVAADWLPIGIVGFFLIGLIAKFGDVANPFPLGLSDAVGFFLAALAATVGFYHRKAFAAQGSSWRIQHNGAWEGWRE